MPADHCRARVCEREEEIEEAKLQLEGEKDEIRQLESQAEITIGSRVRLDRSFWRATDAGPNEGVRTVPTDSCDCAVCEFEPLHRKYKNALQKAKEYKEDLFNKLGICKGCKSTLDAERERIKEQYVNNIINKRPN